MKLLIKMCKLVIVVTGMAGAGSVLAVQPAADTLGQAEQGYRIDQPGTITFTVGVKISGKVEKPQVIIFLPKEKTLYRNEKFDRSFKEELSEPLPFIINE
jgi:hypothetical protein